MPSVLHPLPALGRVTDRERGERGADERHHLAFADLEACKITPTDQGVVDGYQFLYDWAQDHDPEKVSRWVSTNVPPNAPAQQNPFVTGKLAMVITGDWRIAEMAKYAADTNYGFTYIPVPNEGDESATWAGGWSQALIPDSKVRDQAWKFMQYIAGPEGQAVYARFIWSDITATACRWEQALSADGGQTWETNWIMDFTRLGEAA